MSRRLIVLAAIVTLALAAMPARPAGAAAPRSQLHQATPIVANGSWTTYHRDDAHTGYDPSAPAASNVGPTQGWTLNTLDQTVFASPLVYDGVVYAATLNDTVYALNQIDGSVIWSKHLGTPQTGGWGCGNINPTGILGTPVIDAAANRLYAVAEIVTGTNATEYHLYGLDLGANGNVVLNTTLTTSGFDWTIEQQRAALAVHGGYVYVPFGGRAGDCGDYHGYVFSVATSNGTIGGHYQTPGSGAGFWAAGALVIDDSTGNVFATSGNGTASGCDANVDGTPVYENDAVVRLAPITLAHQDAFIPQDWHDDWCANDQDLGGAGPLLISSSLLFQSGKWGTGFLLNPNSLGGMDGQLYPTPKPAAYAEANTCFGNHGDATFASYAYRAPFVYVECEGHGIAAIHVNTATPSFTPCDTCASPDWTAGGSATFGPPIVAGGAVWAATDGGGLFAFDQATGAQIFQSSGFSINRFVTPAEAGGQVFVPSDNVIRSFSFGGNVTVSPSHLDFGGVVPNATSAARTVTLFNDTSSSITVSSVGFTGANTTSWLKGTDSCTGATVAGSGGSCTVQVSLKPTGFGGKPATLSFTDTGPASPQAVPLNGMGALDDSSHLYTLDGWGGIHRDGSSPVLNPSQYWPGWNIARSMAVLPDGTGGYVLDGWGGLHQFGAASPVTPSAYWPGWDIARQVVLAPWATVASPAGWVLDGWGGVHQFGGAPAITGYTWWPYWDIARGLVILPDSTPGSVAGYTLDGWGGLHPFGGAPAVVESGYWPYWDIARGLALTPDSSRAAAGGWVLDGWGGLHPFGTAPSVVESAYWPGWDIARGVVSYSASGSGAGGWVLDGWGGLHPFGNAPTVGEGGYWPGWDIATSLAGCTSNSGSRRRT